MAAPASVMTPLRQSQSGFGATDSQEDIESKHPVNSKVDAEGKHPGMSQEIRAVTTIPSDVSTKIKVLLFTSIIGVVAMHWGYLPVHGNPNVDTFVQFLFGEGLLKSSVPMCFVISGFLFFVHRPDDADGFQFWRRISTRAKSLGAPYALWNIVGAAELYALVRLPAVGQWFPQQFLHPTWRLLLIDMWVSPAAGQLWYLRDLFLLALLTPLFHNLFRLHHLLLLTLPFVAVVPFFAHAEEMPAFKPASLLPEGVLRPDAVFFFPIGCYLALRGVDLSFRLPGLQIASLVIAWISVALLLAVYSMLIPGNNTLPLFAAQRLMATLGVAAAWFGYDVLYPILSTKWLWPRILWLSNYSMWIYCFHSPLSEGAAVAGRHLLAKAGAGSCSHLLFYLGSAVLTIAASLLVGVPFSCHFPAVFGLLTGGRGN